MKLQKGINTKTNREIYYIDGNAYPIRKKLGKRGVGFMYFHPRKMWWIYPNRMDNTKIQQLNELGVDTSILSSTQDSTQQEQQQQEQQEQQQQEQQEKEELTNKTDYDTEVGYNKVPSSKWYGFPIKKNIYTTEFKVDVDSQEIPIKVVLDRWYRKGRRKIPSYFYNIYYKDNSVTRKAMKAKETWGNYNEDELASRIPEMIQELINQKKRTYKILNIEINKEKRNPEFKDFLQKWNDITLDPKKEQELLKQYINIPTVDISEEPYNQKFPLRLHKVFESIHIHPYIEHELAPGSSHFLKTIPLPSEIQDIKQFQNYINQAVTENIDEIKEKYIKYLKSFPYTQEQESSNRQLMEQLISMIGKNYNVSYFKTKLEQLGYIRPSKKVKRKQEGFIPRDSIKWVLETDNILDDIYGNRRKDVMGSQDPRNFFAIIAYWLHRKVKNISSFSEFNLMWEIGSWEKLAKKYGHKINSNDIMNYFDTVSSLLYKNLYGKEHKDKFEQANEFYQNYYNRQKGQPQENIDANSLIPFAEYAQELGADYQEALNSPLKIYRQLSQQYHPDKNPNAEDEFKNLSTLFNQIPNDIKRACNWYKKIIFSEI